MSTSTGSGADISFSLAELAEKVGGRIVGDGSVRITGVRALDDAGPGDLSFLHVGTYKQAAVVSSAAALLVPESLSEAAPELGRPVIVVRSSQLALAQVVRIFHPEPVPVPGIHPTAVVEDGCTIDPSVVVGPYCVISSGVTIGAETVLDAHVVVGPDCRIGRGCRLRPGVVLYHATRLGDRVQVHAGTILGADGFGYASVDGVHHKVPQVGTVNIEDDVEIGANSAIDRAMLEVTHIGTGTKIDNLVQVGHNVQTGKGCLLCGQVGIGGSTVLEDYVVLGGQVGAVDHIRIGKGSQSAAKSAIYGSLEAGSVVGGSPAVGLKDFRRQSAALTRLPELLKRVRSLERQLQELQEPEGSPDR